MQDLGQGGVPDGALHKVAGRQGPRTKCRPHWNSGQGGAYAKTLCMVTCVREAVTLDKVVSVRKPCTGRPWVCKDLEQTTVCRYIPWAMCVCRDSRQVDEHAGTFDKAMAFAGGPYSTHTQGIKNIFHGYTVHRTLHTINWLFFCRYYSSILQQPPPQLQTACVGGQGLGRATPQSNRSAGPTPSFLADQLI